MGEFAAMSTEQQADDDDVVPGVAGGGSGAVLASSMLRSARIPAKTAARVAGAILRTPRPAARRLGRDEDDLPKLAKLDRRFADPAWHGNPVLRRLAMSYPYGYARSGAQRCAKSSMTCTRCSTRRQRWRHGSRRSYG